MNFFEVLYAKKNGAALPANFFDLLFAKSFTPAIEWAEYDGTLPATYSANGSALADYRVYGASGGVGDDSGTAYGYEVDMVSRSANQAWTGWAQDFVTRVGSATSASFETIDGRTCLKYNVTVGYGDYDNKYIFKTSWKANTQYTISFKGLRLTTENPSSIMQVWYTDGTSTRITANNSGNFEKYTTTSSPNKTIKYITSLYSSGFFRIEIDTFMVNEGTIALPYQPYSDTVTPIYIGDTPLGEDEYVSFKEQKVYKYYGELTLKGDETYIGYYGVFDNIKTFYIDIPNNSENINSSLQPYLYCNYYPQTSSILPAIDKTCRYRYQQQIIDVWYIGRVYIMDNDYGNLSSFTTHLSELYDAGKPLKIRYMLANAPIAIDPPVPLPALPTVDGTNIVDYAGQSAAPSRFYAKYQKG